MKHRKHQEELIQKAIAQLQLQIEERKAELCRLENAMQHCACEMQRLQQQGVTISEQLTYSQYIENLKLKMKLVAMETARLEREREKKHLELTEAVKRRKMIEKLKEKRNLCYVDELLKTEQKLLDEAAVCRFKVGSAAAAG